MARRRTFPGHRGPKRLVNWVGPAQQGFVSVSTGNAVIVASFDAEANGMKRPTVVRTRGQIAVAPVVGVTADVDIIGAVGACIVTDNAFGIGISAIPFPFDDAGWEGWFMWRSFSMRFEANAALTAHINQIEFEIDSKGMRKINSDETLVIVAQSEAGAYGISTPLRFLMKLS